MQLDFILVLFCHCLAQRQTKHVSFSNLLQKHIVRSDNELRWVKIDIESSKTNLLNSFPGIIYFIIDAF